MQIQREHTQDEIIQALQRQVEELTTANTLLREELASKERSLAMIAHELRGPLTSIISYAQMLARPEPRSGVIKRGTGIIISQARRLGRLISDLLDSARISSGQFALLREPCDVVALTKEAVEQLRPLAPYHTFIVDAPDGAILGEWDSGRLQQALGNLLDNASKYSQDGTTITVHIWETTGAAHVSVHNQGKGISPADQDQLFRPYGWLAPEMAPAGSGLGLYITKCIVEAHGGSLRLEANSKANTGEQGTTFSFDLPLH